MYKSQARVEFLAVAPRVDALLQSGHSKRRAYDILVQAGAVSMKYRTFCGYIMKYLHKPQATPAPSPVQPPAPTTIPKSAPVATEEKKPAQPGTFSSKSSSHWMS